MAQHATVLEEAAVVRSQVFVDGRARPPDEFGSKEAVVDALKRLQPKTFSVLADGAVIFEMEIPWRLAGGIVRHLNTSNIRRLHYRDAGDIATDMSGGRWSTCYDPIIFTETFELYNGQHRMLASWRSQQTFSWLVIFSGKPDVRRSCDGGKKRTIKQTHGIPNQVASVVGITLMLEARKTGNGGLTRSKKLQRYAEDSGIFEHYANCFGRRRKVLGESHLAAAFAFAEIHRPFDAGRLRDLADDLAEGEQSSQASKLISKQICDRRSLGIRVSSETQRLSEAGLFLRAIQAHLLGADLSKLEQHAGTLNWFDPIR